MNRTFRLILTSSILSICAVALHAGPAAPPVYNSGKVLRGPVAVKADLKDAKELFLVVTDAGDGISGDWANWINPTLVKSDGSKVKLTDLKPKHQQTGWGEIHTNLNVNGSGMKVGETPISFGIGTHAASLISYDLPEGVVSFEAQGGIDDGGYIQKTDNMVASVVFQVYTSQPPARLVRPAAASGEIPYGYNEAKAQLSSMTTPPGLGVELFAAEPEIQNPTNIDIDPKGRIWAVEAVNYRSSFQSYGILRPEGDRVVILEDTKGDGVADKATTFWQSKELQAPLGICVLPRDKGTAVIVSAAPNIWLLEDTNGDDKADKVTKLFTVGGSWDHDHEVHAFVAGLDGKYYFNMGNVGQKLMWPDGKVVKDLAGNDVATEGHPYRQGLVLRCDIDIDSGKASNIETLGWNFRNNFKLAVDSFGTIWQSDNDDDGNRGVRINYVMEYGNYGYTDEMTGAGWQDARTNIESEIPLRHWHLNDPGVMPNLLQTGAGSPTGICVNEGSLLGKVFENQIIHCDAGPRIVRAYPVVPNGAGYTAEVKNILESTDNWFRPSDCAIAPDGSLIVSDWYDPGVGGHGMGDHEKGHIRGRIYRIAPDTAKYTFPVADFSTLKGCLAALQSPNRATAYAAGQKLRAMGAAAEKPLIALWKSPNPRIRSRALAIAAKAPGRADAVLSHALADADSNIRIAAIRLGMEASTSLPVTELPQSIKVANGLIVSEKDPQVNRQLAVSLTTVKDRASIVNAWVELARKYDGKDRWYLEALGIGARGAEDACAEAWLATVSSGWNTPAGRDILWRLHSPKTAPYFVKILADKATPDATPLRFMRAFDFMPSSDEKSSALVVLAGSDNSAIAGEALQRLKNVDLNANATVKNAVNALLQSSKGTGRFVSLVRDFHIGNRGDGLAEVAIKNPSSQDGIEAAKMLIGGDYAAIVERELKGPKASDFVLVLGNTVDQRVVPLLSAIVVDDARDAATRKQAVVSLAQQPAGVQELIRLGKEGKFPQQFRLAAATALASVQLPQFKADIAQNFPLPSAAGGQSLPPIGDLVKMKGDAAHGKELFAKEQTTCITCHKAGDVGVDFAPGLSEIGSKLGKEALYESILSPNAAISMGFETTQITLKDGSAVIGIVRSETPSELVLAMPRGIQDKVKKSDIAKREKLPTSMMPEGLQQMMSTQDLVDLIEYLSSLKTPAK